ncbi:MAG: hypothetical protein R3C42_09560 [Parvularculaceae bacterium]
MTQTDCRAVFEARLILFEFIEKAPTARRASSATDGYPDICAAAPLQADDADKPDRRRRQSELRRTGFFLQQFEDMPSSAFVNDTAGNRFIFEIKAAAMA